MCGRIAARTIVRSLFPILFILLLIFLIDDERRDPNTITGLSFAAMILLILGIYASIVFRRKRIRGR